MHCLIFLFEYGSDSNGFDLRFAPVVAKRVPLALTINGKKRNIHKKEFRILAESCGIPLNSAERMMKKVCSLKAKLFTQIEESCLSAEQKEQMEELISKRLDILS